MGAILKREILAYFRTPLGYVLICVMYLFTGYYFFTYNIYANTTDTNGLFVMMFSVVIFVIPVLTMRLLSEEKRLKTDQVLLTSPLPRYKIVLSKYFAALGIYILSISGTFIMALILQYFSKPDWSVFFGNFIGLFLLGATLIAVCLFISSLTENQIIAAVGGFAASLLLILMDAMVYVVTSTTLKAFFTYMSFNNRYRGFTIGIISFSDIVFFISITAFFLSLTVIVLERRRY